MKMQSLAVIFAIIMIPITMAMSIYIQLQIDTISLQTSYDTKLQNATYDAIKAFQLNESNSNTQNIATEKIRDIEASVQTFYNSLAMSLGVGAFGEEELRAYVPALVYTLYDGFYIYGPFKNIENSDKYEYGLKPYVYYSARYKDTMGSLDITVNYTLDNYISIYGKVGSEYVTRSGYLINPDDVQNINESNKTLYYKGNLIGPEYLREINSETYKTKTYVQYVYKDTENYQREKIYYDESKGTWYRISLDRKRIDLKPADYPQGNGGRVYDHSAYYYYKEAKEFSEWVEDKLGGLRLHMAVGDLSNEDQKKNVYYISTAKTNDAIFDFSNDNDPDSTDSIFNDHRRGVIEYTIQTDLIAAIGGYNEISQINDTTYNFKMPILTEEDWDKILNNVSVISFMQGFPIKNKYYNGYSIVTNNKNKEFVDTEYIYFLSSSNDDYHSVYNSEALSKMSNIIGYRNLDYTRKKITNSDNTVEYYYPQWKMACYDCIVTSSIFNTDQSFDHYIENINVSTYVSRTQGSIQKAYYTAIGRERYNSYKSNKLI